MARINAPSGGVVNRRFGEVAIGPIYRSASSRVDDEIV